MKATVFSALNGSSSPRRMEDNMSSPTIEVRLPASMPEDQRDNTMRASTSPCKKEPMTLPDISSTTRRDREIWAGSSVERPPYQSPAAAYRDPENSAETSQKRKRSTSPEPAPRPSLALAPPAEKQRDVTLPPISETATATAAIAAAAAASAAAAAQAMTKDREMDKPRSSLEAREPYDMARLQTYKAGSRDDEQYEREQPRELGEQREQHERQQPEKQHHEQHLDSHYEQRHEQRERHDRHEHEQQREQRRADLWYSRQSHDDRAPSSTYDYSAKYAAAAAASSLQSPVEEQTGADAQQNDKSAHRDSGSPQSDDYAGRSPDMDDDRVGPFSNSYSPGQQHSGEPTTVQQIAKRRKRNFSNRTKTGCLTCRKRKKKCDETKPECSNCVRGGFICAGYPPQKAQWSKPDLTKPTIQIESKDPNYVPPSSYIMAHQPALTGPPAPFQPQRRDSQPYRRHGLRIEPPQGRPLQSEDERMSSTTTLASASVLASPENQSKLSALSSLSAQANMFPTPISAATPYLDRTPKEYQRVPPLHDLSRTTEPETPQHANTLPQMNLHRLETSVYRQRSPLQHHAQLPPPAGHASQLPSSQHVSHTQHQAQHLPPPQQPLQLPSPHPQHQHLHAAQSQSPLSQPPSARPYHQPAQHPLQQPPQQSQQTQPSQQQQQQQPPPQQHHPALQPQHQQHASHPHQAQAQAQPQASQTHHHSAPRHPAQQHLTQAHQLQQQPSPVEGHHQPPGHHAQYPPPANQAHQHQHQSQGQQQPPQQQQHRPFQESGATNEVAASSEVRVRPRPGVPFFNTIPGARRERDEMYAGRPFYQFDKELVVERERCAAACWKFNNSMNPNIGVSLSERARLFKEILQPRDELQMSPIAHAGSVGDQVIVDAPFHADYGYNITIGDDVYIGRNCHISDAMPVSIGNRVYIGPNVSFYTTTLSSDHTQREGVHSAVHGSRITIGDDVFIGGNVTILAGVSIGHGTTIGAGSVVTSSLPSYAVCYGNPAVVRRRTASS